MVTTVLTTPIVIRISFVLSGMLGVHLNGQNSSITSGTEPSTGLSPPSVINLSIPVTSVEENLITPGLPGQFPESQGPSRDEQERFNIPRDRGQNQRCLGKCDGDNELDIPYINNGIIIEDEPKDLYNDTGSIALIPEEKPCGPGWCSPHETCVSWVKNFDNVITPTSSSESPRVFHECFPDDGIHWNKMTPSSGGPTGGFCEEGKTISVLKQGQPCLSKQPPCELIWQYDCIDERDSPHSCQLKQCPPQFFCAEQVRCDLEPPCYIETSCLSSRF